eukprot:4276823-Pyramimonas_sp.AAC.1
MLARYIATHVQAFDFSDVAPPTVGSIAPANRVSKPAAIGPDGLPRAARQQPGPSQEVLFELMLELLGGFPPPTSSHEVAPLVIAPA